MRRAGLPEAYAGYTASPPPVLNFVMAGLGGFRGIIAEILWFRVSSLQDEGRYMELVQLSDWITMLDPHAAEAWAYNAWNMAYNISIMMMRPEDRWRWIQSGIALLRDQGLRLNPREPRLYRELAWLYQNKIGDNLDSAHLTYKFALAAAMSPLVNDDGTLNDTPEHRRALAAMNLNASRMKDMEKRWGALDWRMPESLAIYWATQGWDVATGNERLMCSRAVYQPLMLSVFRGRFVGDIAHQIWRTEPNPDLVFSTDDIMTEACRLFPSRNMDLVHLRYRCKATAILSTTTHRPEAAHRLYDRLLNALPKGIQSPTFEDVVKGWEPNND